MELPFGSPARCELHAVTCFLSAKGNNPFDIHCQLYKVYVPQRMDVKNLWKGSESLCTDVQTSITNSILMVLRFPLKQLQKWSKNKKCLKIGVWQFASCANGFLKSVRVWLAMWRESSMTGVYEKCHSACKSALITVPVVTRGHFPIPCLPFPLDCCVLICLHGIARWRLCLPPRLLGLLTYSAVGLQLVYSFWKGLSQVSSGRGK